MGESKVLVAKMVPFNPSKGFVLRRYHVTGLLFENDGKWRKVSDEMAAKLRTVHSVPRNPGSPLAFMVLTTEEAAEWERGQRREKKLGADVDDSIMLPEDFGGKVPGALQVEVDALKQENSELRRAMARMENRLVDIEEKAKRAPAASSEEAEETLLKAEPVRPPEADLGLEPETLIPQPPPLPTAKPVACEPVPETEEPLDPTPPEEPPRDGDGKRTTWSTRSRKRGK